MVDVPPPRVVIPAHTVLLWDLLAQSATAVRARDLTVSSRYLEWGVIYSIQFDVMWLLWSVRSFCHRTVSELVGNKVPETAPRAPTGTNISTHHCFLTLQGTFSAARRHWWGAYGGALGSCQAHRLSEPSCQGTFRAQFPRRSDLFPPNPQRTQLYVVHARTRS